MFKLIFKNIKKVDQNIDLKKSVEMANNQNYDRKSAQSIKTVSDVARRNCSAKFFHEKYLKKKNPVFSKRKSERVRDIKESNFCIRGFKELKKVQRQHIVEVFKG